MPRRQTIRPGTAIAVRQVILWTGVLAVLPLVLYPKTFALGQFKFHPAIVLVEWLIYFVAFLFLVPTLKGSQRFVASGLTVVYRLVCALLFAGLAAFNNNYGFQDTASVAMWSYPFTVLLHVFAAPFVLRGIWKIVYAEPAPKPRFAMSTGYSAPRPSQSRTTPTVQAAPKLVAARPARSAGRTASHAATADNTPDFDAAVAYVGEYTGIRMCWMVDREGLPLAFWQRQDYTGAVEYWAPTSIEMIDFSQYCLSRGRDLEPQRIEIRSSAGRVILEAVDEFWLGVLTDHEVDDLVGVRLTQARDMMLKYIQRRRHSYAVLEEV
ncbi:MAG: hypothetical protein GF341_10580 [candidate division Zixibacteria bacterium]|nr:hypothetical protein [candidate division Zixibacteria bacterium]